MAQPYEACIRCGNPTVMFCRGCQQVWYCSTECQSAHWPMHQETCAPPSNALVTQPPTFEPLQTVQALVLFAHSASCNWRMIEIQTPVPRVPGQAHLVPIFDADLNLGEDPGSRICLNDVGGSPLNQPYQVFFRRLFLGDGSPINVAVRGLHPEITYPWAGNIVVFKFDGSRRQRYKHMEQRDIVQIAQFFRLYPDA